jgi:hypothetical protein
MWTYWQWGLNVGDFCCSKESSLKASAVPANSSREEAIDDARVCQICFMEERGVLFLPCGHLVACVKCAPSLSTCAVCRQPFTGTVRAYLSWKPVSAVGYQIHNRELEVHGMWLACSVANMTWPCFLKSTDILLVFSSEQCCQRCRHPSPMDIQIKLAPNLYWYKGMKCCILYWDETDVRMNVL